MSTLIQEFETDLIEVIRNKQAGYYDIDGLYVEGQKERIDLSVVVTPAKGRELLHLPEAQRSSEMLKIYSDEKLLTVDEGVSKIADVVVWRGHEYQVQIVDDWTHTDLPHYRSLAAKVEACASNREESHP